jgi:anthranilate synthase/aminodeoxychorismate synthase-like glutamine amidotransferase
MKILIIDNYDSFTFNLLQALGNMGADVRVFRNDAVGPQEVRDLAPDRIVISPGPGRPEHAGISRELIRAFCAEIPLLGVCLGMQCINEVFGGATVKAPVCVHGKTSAIFHSGKGLYRNLPNPFAGARYHSLIADRVPECLQVDARTEDRLPMGLRHGRYPLFGVQFHPESFLTESGDSILKRFLEDPWEQSLASGL